MATEQVVVIRCDRCEKRVTELGVAGVRLQLGAEAVDLDLCTSCARGLRSAVSPFLEVGAKASRVSLRRPRGRRSPEAPEVRAWALRQGYTLSGRGRIPREVTEAYLAAQAA